MEPCKLREEHRWEPCGVGSSPGEEVIITQITINSNGYRGGLKMEHRKKSRSFGLIGKVPFM